MSEFETQFWTTIGNFLFSPEFVVISLLVIFFGFVTWLVYDSI